MSSPTLTETSSACYSRQMMIDRWWGSIGQRDHRIGCGDDYSDRRRTGMGWQTDRS